MCVAVAPARKTKQGVYAIINHDNLKQKASVWFVSLKVFETTFCVGEKTKRPTRNPVCIRETLVTEFAMDVTKTKNRDGGWKNEKWGMNVF